MGRFGWNLVVAGVALVLMMALAACSTRSNGNVSSDESGGVATHVVTFKVHATDQRRAFVGYIEADAEFVPGSVDLPWSTTLGSSITYPANTMLKLSANPIVLKSGSLTCEIWIDGTLSQQATVNGRFDVCDVAASTPG